MFNLNDKVVIIAEGQYNNAVGSIINIYGDMDIETVYMIKYNVPFGSCVKGMFKESEIRTICE